MNLLFRLVEDNEPKFSFPDQDVNYRFLRDLDKDVFTEREEQFTLRLFLFQHVVVQDELTQCVSQILDVGLSNKGRDRSSRVLALENEPVDPRL